MVLKCYNKATVPLKNLSCFSPYGNLTPPHWYSLSSSSRMAHFRKVLHKANSPTGGNTGEEAGRQAICRGTEGLRRSGRGQRGRAAPLVGGNQALVCSRHWARGQRGAQTSAGELPGTRDPGLGASPGPLGSGVQAHTHAYTYTHTHTMHKHTRAHIMYTHTYTHQLGLFLQSLGMQSAHPGTDAVCAQANAV